MRLLTAEEKPFLDVFLHEATTPPFAGPATKALHDIGVEYGDISYLAWAYGQEAPRAGQPTNGPSCLGLTGNVDLRTRVR
jgi:hypothetical protein